ncbi:hypothetical protein K7432_014746 [Basidiobolus ranarum]|uniref:PAS domain-containing protein n=1 Tax=Basidiobolus ranarum TaxID=34480 RepID=A0ABR2WHC7_9FUNG
MQEINCIIIYDTSDESKILYTSESIVDVTGYTQEEMRGRNGYSLIDSSTLNVIQDASMHIRDEDNMATVLYTNIRHKTEGLIPIESVAGRCYDIVVGVTTRADKGKPRIRASYATSQQIYTKQVDGIVATQRSISSHQRHTYLATPLGRTDPRFSPEPAACMILNRFTRRLTIEFATQTCEFLLGLDSEKCRGLSFLNYIDPDDLYSITEKFENVKVNNAVADFQFSFLSPQYRQSLPVEAAVFCSNDGIIVNIRLVKGESRRKHGLIFLDFFVDSKVGVEERQTSHEYMGKVVQQ